MCIRDRILTECLNTKGYDIQTPFDIEDLKSMLAQMTGNEKGKDEKNEIMGMLRHALQKMDYGLIERL